MQTKLTRQIEEGLSNLTFHTQRVPELEVPIQRSICGIASLLHALEKAGYETDMITLLQQVVAVSSANKPTVYWETDNINVPVTYDTSRTLTTDDLLAAAIQEIERLGGTASRSDLYIKYRELGFSGGFNIRNGFDFRTLERVLKQYYPRLTSAFIDTSTSLDIESRKKILLDSWEFYKGCSACFSLVVSVNRPAFGQAKRAGEIQSKHIIYISNIYRDSITDEYICLYSDPAEYFEENGVNICGLDHLVSHMTGNLAFIYEPYANED